MGFRIPWRAGVFLIRNKYFQTSGIIFKAEYEVREWGRAGRRRAKKPFFLIVAVPSPTFYCKSVDFYPIFLLPYDLAISISKVVVSLCQSLANKHMPAL